MIHSLFSNIHILQWSLLTTLAICWAVRCFFQVFRPNPPSTVQEVMAGAATSRPRKGSGEALDAVDLSEELDFDDEAGTERSDGATFGAWVGSSGWRDDDWVGGWQGVCLSVRVGDKAQVEYFWSLESWLVWRALHIISWLLCDNVPLWARGGGSVGPWLSVLSQHKGCCRDVQGNLDCCNRSATSPKDGDTYIATQKCIDTDDRSQKTHQYTNQTTITRPIYWNCLQKDASASTCQYVSCSDRCLPGPLALQPRTGQCGLWLRGAWLGLPPGARECATFGRLSAGWGCSTGMGETITVTVGEHCFKKHHLGIPRVNEDMHEICMMMMGMMGMAQRSRSRVFLIS